MFFFQILILFIFNLEYQDYKKSQIPSFKKMQAEQSILDRIQTRQPKWTPP